MPTYPLVIKVPTYPLAIKMPQTHMYFLSPNPGHEVKKIKQEKRCPKCEKLVTKEMGPPGEGCMVWVQGCKGVRLHGKGGRRATSH